MKLASLFKWHTEAHYSSLQLKPSNFANALAKNLPIARFIKEHVKGNCPIILDSEKVETNKSDDIGVFRTKTGGTSKEPKEVLRTAQSWVNSFEVINAFHKGKENYVIFGNLTHSLALYGILEALYLGHNVHHVQQLRSKDEIKALVQFKPTFIYITPTQIRFISSHFIILPDVSNVFIGGGRLNSQTREMAEKIFPNAVLNLFYGSSETSFITVSDNATPIGSVGKAFPNVNIKIEQNGPYKNRIWVKSDYLFLKYAQGSNKNLIWWDDWLTINEYGTINTDGYLFLISEGSQRITIADKTLETYEIEDKLKTVEKVIDAAVWTVENQLSDYRIVAAVATKGDVHSELLYGILKELNPVFKPKKIHKVNLNDWPLLASGKTDLRSLKSRFHDQ